IRTRDTRENDRAVVSTSRSRGHPSEDCRLDHQVYSSFEGARKVMKHNADIVKQAQALARSATSWADLANALYHPPSGLRTAAHPSRAERARFKGTAEYAKIRKLLAQAMKKFGVVEGATPGKSGRFVVRLPRSLHAFLQREAEEEGVSLNQLV